MLHDDFEFRTGGRSYVFTSEGKLLTMPSGADGDPPNPTDPPKPADPPADPPKPSPKPELTQEQINSIMAAEKKDGKNSVLKTLGFETVEEAEAFVKAKRDAELAAMSEADRKVAEAALTAKNAEQETANAKQLVHTVRKERALEVAGVPAGSSTELAALLTVPVEATDEDMSVAVTALKTKFPALFSGTATPPPSSDPGNPPGPGDRPSPADSKKAADALLLQRHPDVAKRRAAEAAQST